MSVSSFSSDIRLHKGSCHCGAVTWQCYGPARLTAFACNCSICRKKQNYHFIVSRSNFTLLTGSQNITVYKFNTGLAKHTFCKTCGVQSFYTPRSNPDSIGIMPHCIDSDTVESVEYVSFDGQQWEKTMETQAPVAFPSTDVSSESI